MFFSFRREWLIAWKSKKHTTPRMLKNSAGPCQMWMCSVMKCPVIAEFCSLFAFQRATPGSICDCDKHSCLV